jgi:hypothetical protein
MVGGQRCGAGRDRHDDGKDAVGGDAHVLRGFRILRHRKDGGAEPRALDEQPQQQQHENAGNQRQ